MKEITLMIKSSLFSMKIFLKFNEKSLSKEKDQVFLEILPYNISTEILSKWVINWHKMILFGLTHLMS